MQYSSTRGQHISHSQEEDITTEGKICYIPTKWSNKSFVSRKSLIHTHWCDATTWLFQPELFPIKRNLKFANWLTCKPWIEFNQIVPQVLKKGKWQAPHHELQVVTLLLELVSGWLLQCFVCNRSLKIANLHSFNIAWCSLFSLLRLPIILVPK